MNTAVIEPRIELRPTDCEVLRRVAADIARDLEPESPEGLVDLGDAVLSEDAERLADVALVLTLVEMAGRASVDASQAPALLTLLDIREELHEGGAGDPSEGRGVVDAQLADLKALIARLEAGEAGPAFDRRTRRITPRMDRPGSCEGPVR